MACQLNNLCNRLNNTTAYGTLANDLCQDLIKVDQILTDDQTVELKSFLVLIETIRITCIELHKEILNPSCKIYTCHYYCSLMFNAVKQSAVMKLTNGMTATNCHLDLSILI